MSINVTAARRRKSLLRFGAVAALAAFAFGIVAGCEETPARDFAVEGEAWKAAIAEAYERNDSLDNYRFEGSITAADGGRTPSASGALLPTIEGGIAWSGVLYREPARLEADVRVGANGGEGARTFPMLAQDGLFYISVPPVNKPDEYFVIDLAKARTENDPLPIEPLLNAADAFDDLARTLVARIAPEWVRAAEADAPASPLRFVVDVTDENAEPVAAAVREAYADWAASLPPELGANAFGLSDESLRLLPGGTIVIALDEAGYVVDQRVELPFADGTATANEADSSATFSYAFRLTEPNGSPDMTRSVPENVIPFENVLAFLAAGGGAAAP